MKERGLLQGVTTTSSKSLHSFCILCNHFVELKTSAMNSLLFTGEEVAIKLIALGQNFYQKYVYREIMNHHKFAHPHVVAFIEVFLTPRVSA